LTVVYVFPSDVPDTTTIILVANPKSKPGAADNFSSSALYNFHAGADKQMTAGKTFTFKFNGSDLTVGIVNKAVVELGEGGTEIGKAKTGVITNLANGLRVWAGTVKDPFFGNQMGLRGFKTAASEGKFNPAAFDNGQNAFAGSIASAMVLDIPNALLPETIYYYGTSAWYDHGHWHQVNRIGFVLMPHLYLSSNDENTAKNNDPITTDRTRRELVASTIERYARLGGGQSNARAYAEKMADMLLPDAVPYRVGTASHYSVENPNGRGLADDAMDVALTWLAGVPIIDKAGVEAGRENKPFPFVVYA
jgi:hypothetical protein